MSGSPSLVVRALREVVGRGSVQAPSDAALLDRFVRERDERAFESLVRRYGPVVNGACRRLLRNGPDVEDASQSTFLALACKAGAISDAQALGGWLHAVAVRIALRVRADTAKRAGHEARAQGLRPICHADPVFRDAARDDLRSVIDEAISRLSEKYRAPIVLCYLEGRTNEEAAAELGCPTGTVVTRLARARDRLRVALGRRGVGVTAGVLAAALSQLDTVVAAPAAPDVVARAATVFITHRAAASVSTRVALLTEKALRAMSTNRLKVFAGVLSALCLVGTGSGLLAVRAAAGVPAADRLPAGTDDPAERAVAATSDIAVKSVADNDGPKDGSKNQTRPKTEEVVSKSFKTGKSPNVHLDLFNGTIEVVADSTATVDAQLTKQSQAETKELADDGLKNIQLELSQEKDAIHVTAKRLREDVKNRSEGVNAALKVPPGAILDLGTNNGSVKLFGGTGKVVIRTSNGSVHVKDAKGELHLTTTNGPIAVTGAQGTTDVNTSNGTIDLQVQNGVVKAHTSNGALRFQGTLANGQHSLTTSNGGIQLTLPATAHFRVDASTVNGTITSDFSDGQKSKPGMAHLQTTVGEKPAVSLTLRTMNGGIQIRKETGEPKK
jgi:RNA polymerase sigma factor (sigma-70 family)